jgi:hypothetical protein
MNSLQAIFCQIQTFYETIQPVLVGRDVMIEDDIMEYLKTAIVCFEKEHVLNVKNIAPASHSSHQQVFKIKKIVDRVIASLLSTPDHVLCTGYRLWTGKPNVAKLNHRIECFYPNPMVNHIKDREWERIAEMYSRSN